jgi:signal peptide peptidase SppA
MHGILSIAELGVDRLFEAAHRLRAAHVIVENGVPIRVVGRLQTEVVPAASAAVIPLVGVFMRRSGTWYPDVTDVDEARAAIDAAAADPSVRRIVLRVDSPGGTVDGLSELGTSVTKAAAVKPVVAQVEGMAASAALYAIAGATEIVAGPMDVVGSIGTIAVITDWSKLAEKFGVRVVAVASGPLKATGVFGTEFTEEQQGYIQGLVDAYAADFKATVARGRKMSMKAVEAVADGRVFLSAQAKSLGLIDRIGGLADTLGRFATMDRARVQASQVAVLGLTTPRAWCTL